VGLVFCLPQQLAMRGDQERIRRLAVNFLTNAARHVKAGTIRVSLTQPASDQLEICVEDTGEGIAEKVLAVLGEPLLLNSSNLDAHRQARGAGLGLSVCKEIVARHGGSLFIESSQGIGTRVRALLRGNLEEPSPVSEKDCVYASSFPCRENKNAGLCQSCYQGCLFQGGH
jgi:signal transduction histidine kinase